MWFTPVPQARPNLLWSLLGTARWGAAALVGIWIVLASSMAVAQPATPAPAPASAPAARTQAAVATSDPRLEKSARAIDEGKFSDAFTLVGEAVKDGRLTDTDSDWASYLTARALAGLGKAEEAETVAKERYAINPNGYTWASLVAIEVTTGRHDLAASTILDLEEEDFIWVNKLRPALIESVVGSLDGPKTALRDRLIVRLVEGRYSGPASQRVPDTLRLRYINMLLRQNRLEDAARQTSSIETPAILSLLLTDRSFEPLWAHPTIKALMQSGALLARVDRGVQARLEQPELSSSDWLDVMRSLRIIGRADEAVRLGLHALEQARKENRPAGSALRLEMARAYAEQGESWAARRTARELLREESSLPAATRASIAQVLDDAGDDEGALTLLGTMQGAARTAEVLKLTVCAAHDLGRVEQRDAAILALEAQAKAAPAELFEALVCTGQKDKAAAALGEMLKQPGSRTAAILTAQLYADPPKPDADHNNMRYRMTALIASAEVQEAVKPYARTIGLPFTMANARPN